MTDIEKIVDGLLPEKKDETMLMTDKQALINYERNNKKDIL